MFMIGGSHYSGFGERLELYRTLAAELFRLYTSLYIRGSIKVIDELIGNPDNAIYKITLSNIKDTIISIKTLDVSEKIKLSIAHKAFLDIDMPVNNFGSRILINHNSETVSAENYSNYFFNDFEYVQKLAKYYERIALSPSLDQRPIYNVIYSSSRHLSRLLSEYTLDIDAILSLSYSMLYAVEILFDNNNLENINFDKSSDPSEIIEYDEDY
jgi:hypothetical protein